MKPRLYKVQKLKITVKKRDPWGDSDGPKATFEQQILLFFLCLLKNNELIRMKYAQNHFESTFGSAYFKQKKTKLKLVKTVKKEPRKASFPWGLGLLFGNPMRYARISIFNLLKQKHKYNACNLWIFIKLPCKMDDFHELDLECLMRTFRNKI